MSLPYPQRNSFAARLGGAAVLLGSLPLLSGCEWKEKASADPLPPLAVASDTIPVNPTCEMLQSLSDKTLVVVEGVFQGFTGKPEHEFYLPYESGNVKTDDGRLIYLDFPTGKIGFSGGVHANLEGRPPEPGDRVSITAFVTRAPRLPRSSGEVTVEAGVRLAAHFDSSCLLTAPEPARRAAYETLRSDVQTRLDNMEKLLYAGEPVEARRLMGATRKLELTRPELDRIDELTSRISLKEHPMFVSRVSYNPQKAPNYWGAGVDLAYGVVVESMNREEFVDFAGKVLRGELRAVGEGADPSYIDPLAKELGLDKQTREQLLRSCIDTRQPRIQGKPYDPRHLSDICILTQAYDQLSLLGTPSSTQYVIDQIYALAERGEYRKPGWATLPESEWKESMFTVAATALTDNKKKMPREVLVANLPRLKEVLATLQASNADESLVKGDLDWLISTLSEKK